MAIKSTTIFNKLVEIALTIPGTHAERVHTEPIEPSRVSNSPHVSIIEVDDKPTRIDGGKTERSLVVEIGVVMKVNPNSATPTDAQMRAIYWPMHAKWEELRDGLANYFLTMIEDDQGPQWETVWSQQAIRLISCTWHITYTRSLGATE